MTVTHQDNDLIHRAIDAIAQMQAVMAGGNEIPFFRPTDLGALPAAEQENKTRFEDATYRARPTEAAAHFCLNSAAALLDITRSLLSRASEPCPVEREKEWKELSELTKVAGRSAYRAALILADPRSAASAPRANLHA